MLHAPGELFEELVRAHRHRWTHSDELLALILEQLDQLTIITHAAYSDPAKRPRKMPTPYRYPRPRPASPAQPGPRATIADIRRFFIGR